MLLVTTAIDFGLIQRINVNDISTNDQLPALEQKTAYLHIINSVDRVRHIQVPGKPLAILMQTNDAIKIGPILNRFYQRGQSLMQHKMPLSTRHITHQASIGIIKLQRKICVV